MRILTVALSLLFVALSMVSTAAAEQHDSGLLQQFVTLPSGVGAEGLAVHNGHFYVAGFSFTSADGTILVYNSKGVMTQSITVPGFPGVGQLAFARDGTLYGVAANLNTQVGAVIRVNPSTGKVTTVASGFKVANGLALDDAGNLFVTDLAESQVYKVTPAGSVSVFASDPLLAAALIPQAGFTFGTNDLAFNKDQTALYVTDVGLGTVVRVGINKDGTAGKIENIASITTPDGIAFDVKGNIYVTSVFTNTVLIVSRDGSVHTLQLDTSRVPLSNPSNLAFLGRRMYVTNLDFSGTGSIDFATVQSPGLPLEG